MEDYFDDVVVLFLVSVLKSERLRDKTGSLDPAYRRIWHHCPWDVSILFGTIAIFAFDFSFWVHLCHAGGWHLRRKPRVELLYVPASQWYCFILFFSLFGATLH